MAIAFPRVLKNVHVFVDGRGYAGRFDEITLPTLTIKTEEWRGGGMDAPVSLDMGMEGLEATFNVSDFDPELFKTFGLLSQIGLPLTCKAAMQRQGSEEVTAVTAYLRGAWSGIETGSWKPGDKNANTFTMKAHYYRLVADGEDLLEVDVINMIRRVAGIDQLESQRLALGL